MKIITHTNNGDFMTSFLNQYKISNDYILDSIIVDTKTINYLYIETLVDTKSLNDLLLGKLSLLNRKQIAKLNSYLPFCNIIIIQNTEIENYLNNGFIILYYNKIYACELKANINRGVQKIESELSLGGAKDSFNEYYNTNLGLIRRRIKSSQLKVTNKVIGTYSKTKVGIIYIEGICKKDLVYHVEKQLNKISIDGIIDSSYLKNSLEPRFQLFPTIIQTERPDKCSMALLEGKIIILVDNSPYALILPSLFLDFFHTTDDYFQKPFHTSFIRIIRVLAFLISIFTPAIYISVTTRNYSWIPFSLLLMLKAGRTFVPFPAYLEAIFMIICFEILKESDLRMSTTSGSAISILGGLILGDAAVAAGIVSPIMIIVIAISSIAGLIFHSNEFINTLRTYKILFLILGSIFGLYGVLIGLIHLIIQIHTTEIFGYSYFALDKNEWKDSFIKLNPTIKLRNSKLTNNIIRGRYQ